jgi:hypothetical protein
MKRSLCCSSALALPLLSSLLAAPVSAADLDALQGAWSARRTNQEGRVSSQTIEFKKDRMTFRVKDDEGGTRMFAQGAVALQKLGPFHSLKITDIEAGRSEDATEAVEDVRTSIFVLAGDTLTIASNFDKTRDNERPRVETYTRTTGAAAAKPPAGADKLAGTWKLDVRLNDNDFDYELRLATAGNGLTATLVSPRSGEYKFKKVTWAEEKLSMEIDRDIEGNAVTFLYSGTLGADGLSGTVKVKGLEDQFSGSWKARK